MGTSRAVRRRGKSDDLTRYNPAEVADFEHALEGVTVEALVSIPPQFNRAFHTLHTVKHGNWEVVRAYSGVSIRLEGSQEARAKDLRNLLHTKVVTDKQVAGHEISRVRLLLLL